MCGSSTAVRTIILCGGRGTRIAADVPEIPKPLVEVGGIPILDHIIRIYAHFGFLDFVLALGYRGDLIEKYFRDPKRVKVPAESIELRDTGVDTPTGERIRRLRNYTSGTFFATYGDGVADIDITALLDFHKRHGRAATVTVVRPTSNFGILELHDDHVVGFLEKPVMKDWVNGGFFVMEQRIFDYIEDEDVLERGPMERLAAAGELMAFRHEGFWQCMDTYKDTLTLNDHCRNGDPPWLRMKGC